MSNDSMKLKLKAVHLPPGIDDLPTIKTVSGTIYEFQKSTDVLEGKVWKTLDETFNARVVDRFLELLSEQNSIDVESGDLVGIVWVYEPKSSEGSVSIDYIQIILNSKDLDTFHGSEIAQESELEFFKAIE